MVGDGDDYHDEGGFRSKAMFFPHTLFCRVARWSPKNIKGRKTVFILARHQICTAHEKSRNQSHRPGSRLGMVESGSGSVRSWPKGGQGPFTIGGAICWDGEQRRCEGLHASMGQNGKQPGNEGCDMKAQFSHLYL